MQGILSTTFDTDHLYGPLSVMINMNNGTSSAHFDGRSAFFPNSQGQHVVLRPKPAPRHTWS
jgi:hypothetical protein